MPKIQKFEDFMSDFLDEKSRYKEGETISRYLSGRIMPNGMKREVKQAQDFAFGEIGITPEDFMATIDDEDVLKRIGAARRYAEGRSKAEAMTGNQNAVKDIRRDSVLYIRCTVDEKNYIVRSVHPKSVSDFVLKSILEKLDSTRSESDA